MSTPHNTLGVARRAASAVLLAALLGALPACVTEGEAARQPKLETPWPQDNPPADMEALAEDLMAFQGTTGSLPLTLKQLDQAHLGTAGIQYGARGYAYHPQGIGILRDGWCVLAVNDRIRPKEEGHVWAVVRPPVRVRGTPALQPAKVPLAELEKAAQMAEGKKP